MTHRNLLIVGLYLSTFLVGVGLAFLLLGAVVLSLGIALIGMITLLGGVSTLATTALSARGYEGTEVHEK